MVKKKGLPGTRVRGSDTGRPLNAALDLLGRRQTLRILWELKDGAMTFRELQSRCDDPSPTLLNKRLAELREALIVEHVHGEGYQLTDQGLALNKSLVPLYKWAINWGQLFGVENRES